MKYIFFALILSAYSFNCEASKKGKAQNLTKTDLVELQKAEESGSALYSAKIARPENAQNTSRENELVEMAAKLECEGTYTPISVLDEKNSLEKIYLLLLPKSTSALQVGRHIKFSFSIGTNSLVNTELSSKSCLAIPIDENSTPYVTHILSDFPTEFHVFLSLYYKETIFVGTKKGPWKVEAGKIFLLE